MLSEIIKQTLISSLTEEHLQKAKLTIIFCAVISALVELVSDLIDPGTFKIVSPCVWGFLLLTMWIKLSYDLGISISRNICKILGAVLIYTASAYIIHVIVVILYTLLKLFLFHFGINDFNETLLDTMIMDPCIRFMTIYCGGLIFVKLVATVFKLKE